MPKQQTDIIRNAARHDACLRGQMWIAPESSGVVAFSRAAGLKDGRADVDIVDVSQGGLGLLTTVFVPRRCQIVVAIYGTPTSVQPEAVLPCTVKRVCMTDRRPAYLIGASFGMLEAEASASLRALLGRFEDPATGAPTAGVER